ncbi:MAG: HepT-like ribonuclease domain-containing protein [Pseudomonadota bacterium]
MLEEKFPDYEWRMIKDFRNLIIHEYFGVDLQIVWDVTRLELDQLKEKIVIFRKELEQTEL